jgi:SAM-dependent methyltransferase
MQNLLVKMKFAARRVLAPVARPVWSRIRPRLIQLDELVKLNDAWHQHLPALVNATASVGAVAREQARMKREYDTAFTELRAAIGQLQAHGGAPAVRVIALDKVQRARAAGARLHLGDAPAEGFINVSMQEAAGADIVAPFTELPFARAEVTEIVASHVLERFTQDDLERRLLPHWCAILKPGGSLRAVGADAPAMINAVASGSCALEDFRRAFFDAPSHDAARRNMLSAESLATALRAAGMVDVQVIAQGRRAGAGYEFEVAARTAAN